MKILLRNTQRLLGDRIAFTPAVRDLKTARPMWQIGVKSAGPEVWLNNPHIDEAVTEQTADQIFDIGPGDVTRGSKTNGLHFMQAFFNSLRLQLMERELVDILLGFGPIKPDLHLSEAEKASKVVAGEYWVINTDTGPMSCKRWPDEYFQKFVDALPSVTFVQVGLTRDNQRRLRGENVIDMLGHTRERELFSLVYNSLGVVSLVSSLMHVAGAFGKPGVILAGGREPDTFERYPNHRFLDVVGALKCCAQWACWHNALTACEDHDGQYARCMRLIEPEAAEGALLSYYEGGAIKVAAGPPAKAKPILKILANARAYGGAERSVAEIASMFIEKGWRVQFATPTENPSLAVLEALPREVELNQEITKPCDVFLWYCSDAVYAMQEDRFKPLASLSADRRVMAITYKIGKIPETPWALQWDQYLFLSSAMRSVFLERFVHWDRNVPPCAVMAPPVNLGPFLDVDQNFNQGDRLQIMRHSSQGDKKYPATTLIGIMDELHDCDFLYKPGPSWLRSAPNVKAFRESPDPADVAAFLSEGHLFLYLLPVDYTDQGPRVIVEAMAAGLPVLAENRDGARDRVTPETGWLVDNHAEAIELIQAIKSEPNGLAMLCAKGKAARQRAVIEFNRWKWFEAIRG
jgi:ADP-heptose:LPS heptosyltransferase